MNTAQIQATPAPADQYHDWRAVAPCASLDPDLFFDRAEEDPAAEAEAKATCGSCPFRENCLTTAMIANEEWGIWGGMTPDERKDYRPLWQKLNGGRGAVRTMRERSGVVRHRDPGIERHYTARLKAAQKCRSLALQAGDFHHRRDEFLSILELIISHPTESSTTIARWSGMSKTKFNDLKREVFAIFNVEETA